MIRKQLFNYYRAKAYSSIKSINLAKLLANHELISNQPGVYLIYNINTLKPYVGESYHVRRRLIQHATTKSPTQQIDLAIKHLGAENFAVAFLQWSKDLKPRRNLEKQYVKLFNAYYNGYNGSIDGHPKTKLQRWVAKERKKLGRKLGGQGYLNHQKYKGWLTLAKFVHYQRQAER